MQKLLFRIENFLWVIPVLLYCVCKIFIGNSALDVHLHDTYFVIGNGLELVLIFALLLIAFPYFFHWLLRKYNQENKTVSVLHVGASVAVMIISVCWDYISIAGINDLGGMPRRYYDYNDWNKFAINSPHFPIAVLATLFLLLQIAFLAYALVVVLFKPNKVQNVQVSDTTKAE